MVLLGQRERPSTGHQIRSQSRRKPPTGAVVLTFDDGQPLCTSRLLLQKSSSGGPSANDTPADEQGKFGDDGRSRNITHHVANQSRVRLVEVARNFQLFAVQAGCHRRFFLPVYKSRIFYSTRTAYLPGKELSGCRTTEYLRSQRLGKSIIVFARL